MTVLETDRIYKHFEEWVFHRQWIVMITVETTYIFDGVCVLYICNASSNGFTAQHHNHFGVSILWWRPLCWKITFGRQYLTHWGLLIYICVNKLTIIQIIISGKAKVEVVRRKHIVHLTGFGAYSSTCCKGTDNCAGTMGVDQLPSSPRSGCKHATMPATTNALRDILPP